ncbi:hypothetical protein ACHAQH_003546 [Verticillium albo-atrum]
MPDHTHTVADRFVMVPATLSPRYKGVEDPIPRQSRLKYLIIASGFLFSIAISIYCVVGLIYSSQPHFLPATLAVGTGASVLVIGFILAFLKCWSRIRSRLPAVIPGNSRHGFEVAPNDEGSSGGGYGGFRGWLTMDMPTKIGVTAVEMSNFLSRTGDALFGSPAVSTEEPIPERTHNVDTVLQNGERVFQEHPSIKDETFGRMSFEVQSRTSTPVYTSKGRVRQGSTDRRRRQASETAGTISNGRATSGDIPSAYRARCQSVSATYEHRHRADVSIQVSTTKNTDNADAEKSKASTGPRNRSASTPQRQPFNETSNPLKTDLARARNVPVAAQPFMELPSANGALSGRLGNLFREDTIPDPCRPPPRSQTHLPAPAAIRQRSDSGSAFVKRWQVYEDEGKQHR